jgi:nucleotide-binding universal stress UspA family protein
MEHADQGITGAPQDRAAFSDVLCAIDGTPESMAAVAQAGALAAPGGQLTILTATAFRGGGERRSPAIGPARAQEITDHAVAIAREAGVSSVVEVDPDGPPPSVILGWTEGRDLLSIGAPPTSLIGSRFVRGVADAALGAFTTSMLVARPTPMGGRFGERIIVASDGHEGSDDLVACAAHVAGSLGAEVRLVHSARSPSSSSASKATTQAAALRDACGGSQQAQIESAGARTAIAEAAEDFGASLIIMGSRRPRGLAQLGSVSAWVVHDGPCSVLILPPEALGA